MPDTATTSLQDAFAERLKTKKLALVHLDVVLDPALADAVRTAEAELAAASDLRDRAQAQIETSEGDDAKRAARARDDADRAVADAEAKLEEAKAAADEAAVTFHFQQIPRPEYEELIRELPITDGQREEIEASGYAPPAYDTDRFPPALMAACAVDPVRGDDGEPVLDEHGQPVGWVRGILTRTTAEAMWEEWEEPTLMVLWSAVSNLQQRMAVRPGKAPGSASTPRTAKKSRTASKRASR